MVGVIGTGLYSATREARLWLALAEGRLSMVRTRSSWSKNKMAGKMNLLDPSILLRLFDRFKVNRSGGAFAATPRRADTRRLADRRDHATWRQQPQLEFFVETPSVMICSKDAGRTTPR
jgi:hypothetical protein